MKKTLAACMFIAMLLLFAGCAVPKAAISRTELALTVGAEEEVSAVTENCTGCVWTTSDENVAALSWGEGAETVTVRGVSEGTATVRLMYMDKVLAECEVKVDPSPLTVFLPEGKLVLVKNGEATVKAFCDVPVEEEAVWEISDGSIGFVDWQGLTARVKALKRGTATVTVSLGSYRASFELLVGLS